MDDNYSSELAALERLAQAEEQERQRVTTDNEWTTRDFAALRVDYALLSEQNARLLAVAEAARALKKAYSEATVGIEDYELELGELFDTLKALE